MVDTPTFPILTAIREETAVLGPSKLQEAPGHEAGLAAK